jgi:acyl-homoserine lactone synthase
MASVVRAITDKNRAQYEREILEHYRLRHEIYVVERNWADLFRPDGLERDQFDGEGANYILALDDDRVVGGSRLISTLRPHLLSEVFPHMAAARGLPRAANVYEWTRMFVAKERREGRNSGRTAGAVICGVLEHCLSIGATEMTALVEMWWLPRFHEMGFTLKPLGLPELINGEWSIAVSMTVDEQTLELTRAFHDIDGPVLGTAEAKSGSKFVAA